MANPELNVQFNKFCPDCPKDDSCPLHKFVRNTPPEGYVGDIKTKADRANLQLTQSIKGTNGWEITIFCPNKNRLIGGQVTIIQKPYPTRS